MSDVVRYETSEAVATITLNRPDQRNALSREVVRLLGEMGRRAQADDDVAAVVLTGADPAFCAGVDLKEAAEGREPGAGADGSALAEDEPADERLPRRRGPMIGLDKPLIGAVNGTSVTGGLELALQCDFLIASERARFADTHTRVGVMPGWGLSVLLPRAVGIRRAMQMSMTGNYVDAETALLWGLVNEVVPHADVVTRAQELAADIASNDVEGVHYLLETYRMTAGASVREAWDIEGDRARSFTGTGWDPEAIAARRDAVMDRGRSQQG